MEKASIRFEVIVNGNPVYEYSHEGDTYIEGRKGSSFELRVKNLHYKDKYFVVPSVDGLSPLDGETAGPDSPGFVVKAGETLNIPGWMIDSSRSAKFEFQDRERSYATGVNPKTTNVGVIGILAYREEEVVKPIPYKIIPPLPVPPIDNWPAQPWVNPGWPGTQPPNIMWTSDSLGDPYNILVGTSTSNVSEMKMTLTSQSTQTTSRRVTLPANESIGVGWGAQVDFKVNQTEFNRGDFIDQFVFYYDSRNNLKRKGIIIESRDSLNVRPQAFPGIGCKPPANWRG